ncbi:hypothetical protein LCGC14_0152630, partial [marine sediment metagenome]
MDIALFDPGQFQAELALKSSPIGAFKKAIRHADCVLQSRFEDGRDIRQLIHERAWVTDQILQQAWARLDCAQDPGIALLAVGGYGRGELHPHSDIDLLILVRDDAETFRSSIEIFLMLLWDIGLEVGQSVRSIEECQQEAKADLTARYRKAARPDAPQHNATYAAMIHSVDESVGRITKALDELHLAKDTVVIFMSDNGGLVRIPGRSKLAGQHATSNAPLRGGKAMIYEGGIREPMIVRWPGTIRPGSTCSVPVISDDFYPTMLALAGVKPTKGKVIDGVDISPLLTGGAKLDRDA